jgi:hypothetical protein
MRTRTSWINYFTGNPTLMQNEYKTRQTLSGTNVYVLTCLFQSITSTSSGGAMYCTSVSYLLVESSSFFSCNSSIDGGAIYFSYSSGQCVIYEVCSYDCCTTSKTNGQFAYIQVNNGISSKNYFNYSSITRSLNENSASYYVLRLRNGKICCPSVNISMNKCYWYSGIICYPFLDSNSVTCSLTYSSFNDNNATSYTCIMLWTTGANFEMKSCNVLRNTQVDFNTDGTITTSGYVNIFDSCILGNKARYNFKTYYSTTLITISNCTIDSEACDGSFSKQSTVIKSFIHALNHMSTQNCHAMYDSVGTLTPNTQPSSKSQKLCNTCKRLLNLTLQSNSVLLTSLFIFSFIK